MVRSLTTVVYGYQAVDTDLLGLHPVFSTTHTSDRAVLTVSSTGCMGTPTPTPNVDQVPSMPSLCKMVRNSKD